MLESSFLVSLVIVTYRREDLLLSSLHRLRNHLEEFSEIIVVDNGRSEELAAHLTADFGTSIRLIQPPHNLGAVARTLGIVASSGDLVVTLDDDVYLTDVKQLKTLKAFFACDPRVGCASFKILTSTGSLNTRDWCHPRDHEIYGDLLFDTAYISEGCCAFNGKLVRSLGAYSTDLFIGQESVELAARILDEGYSIYYFPNVSVTHFISLQSRTAGRLFYYNARNIYWIAVRRFPPIYAVKTVVREWTALLLFAAINRFLYLFLQGCFHGFRETKSLLQQRNPVSTRTVRRIQELNRLKPSIARRFLRLHRSHALN